MKIDPNTLNSTQRNQRMNIRNAYLVASIEEMERGQEMQDDFGKRVLQEMIDCCREHNVTNHGETPAF